MVSSEDTVRYYHNAVKYIPDNGKNDCPAYQEMWNNLVQAFKVTVFNPEGLSPGQLAKAVTKLIAAGVAVAGG